MIGRKERKVSPKDVDDGAGINGARRSISEGKIKEDGGKDGELDHQERGTVIWIEKLKLMGP